MTSSFVRRVSSGRTLRRCRCCCTRYLSTTSTSTSSFTDTKKTTPTTTTNTTTKFGFRDVMENEKERMVGDVFHRVARTYDVMNDVMSVGIHRVWKDHFVATLAPQAGMRVLDVAGGTGDVAFRILRALNDNTSAHTWRPSPPPSSSSSSSSSLPSVVVCDINASMLKVGEARANELSYNNDRIQFVEGNAEKLPFDDSSFDAYTIAFGLRNVTHPDRALAEAYRVLRPGGRIMVLEFSHMIVPMLARMYDAYSFNVIPWLGERIAGDRDSYQYLVESIRNFPTQPELQTMMDRAGFQHTSYENLSLGIAAIHSGFKLQQQQQI